MEKVFRSEIFLGLVTPVGIDLDRITQLMNDYLSKKFNYIPHTIKLSGLIHNVDGVTTQFNTSSEYSRIDTGMRAGNEAREISKQNDILAAHSIVKVEDIRKSPNPKEGNVYIFRSVKNPEEPLLYRIVYGKGFFLLGFASSRKNKKKYLIDRKGMTPKQADELINRDESESSSYGQDTRNTFFTSDVFFDVDNKGFQEHLKRFLDLIFGSPYITPTKDEFAMFLAFSASYRSADLSRQVGAVVSSQDGEIIATGCNDVPKKGGGLYWSDDLDDARDFTKGYDPNEKWQNKIAAKIVSALKAKGVKNVISQKDAESALKDSGLFDITEYGRVVHAEMEALLACSRVGVSPRQGTIYSTTFPCHNCAKHIVASGEPYTKSKALILHDDSIEINREFKEGLKKVVFQPFIGVGPNRFIDLFSTKFSKGVKIIREKNGRVVKWSEKSAVFRFPLLNVSYRDKEKLIGAKIAEGAGNGKRNNGK